MRTTPMIRMAPGLAVLVVLIIAGPARGAGFQIAEQCTKCQGTAYGGVAATADDPSTLFFNPAGMTRLDYKNANAIGGIVAANIHYLILEADFDDTASTNAIGGIPIGKDSDDGAEHALVPNLYYTHHVTERLALGLGVTAPYGLLTEYSKDWIGRYHAVKSELVTFNINPALAYQITDQLSIGAGFSAQYADVELTNALDFGTLAFLAGVPGVTPSTPAFDGFNRLTGDDWGFGWNAGILYALSERTRIGLSYRSKVKHRLEGKADITGNAQLAAVNPAFASRKRDIKADLTTPPTLNLGVYHELNDRWAVMAGASWTDWREFDEIRVEFQDGGFDTVQPEDWTDSWRIAAGATYQLNDRWTLRGGLQYDESPIPKDRLTPRVPENHRYWLTLGAGYRYGDDFTFDFAYTYVYVDDFNIDDTEVTTGDLAGVPVGNTLEGEYEPFVSVVSAQLTWRF